MKRFEKTQKRPDEPTTDEAALERGNRRRCATLPEEELSQPPSKRTKVADSPGSSSSEGLSSVGSPILSNKRIPARPEQPPPPRPAVTQPPFENVSSSGSESDRLEEDEAPDLRHELRKSSSLHGSQYESRGRRYFYIWGSGIFLLGRLPSSSNGHTLRAHEISHLTHEQSQQNGRQQPGNSASVSVHKGSNGMFKIMYSSVSNLKE